ncbi:MAG: hypothetical protein WDN27_05935 [Candidatus Saccharibacteria bacterium]
MKRYTGVIVTIINHSLVGGLIGKFVPWPIGLPLAFASHFVLDMLPHYGIPTKRRNQSASWKAIVVLDIASCVCLIIWCFRYHHYAIYACGQIAAVPDFIWVHRAIKGRSFDFSNVKSRYERWHIRIQRYEFPGGIWIELPLAAVLFYFVIIRTV